MGWEAEAGFFLFSFRERAVFAIVGGKRPAGIWFGSLVEAVSF